MEHLNKGCWDCAHASFSGTNRTSIYAQPGHDGKCDAAIQGMYIMVEGQLEKLSHGVIHRVKSQQPCNVWVGQAKNSQTAFSPK